MVVNRMIERMKSTREKVYLEFLDTEKSYDRTNKRILSRLLARMGISERLVGISHR